MSRKASKVGFAGRSLFLAALSGLACLGSGCGSGSSLAPVSGRVTVNGQPLTRGHVTFHPNKSKGNTFGGLPTGEINAQGEYTLQTKGKPGAPTGAYKVTVSGTEATTEDNTNPSTKSSINSTYSLPDISPLEAQVVDKPAAGAYDLKLGP